MKNKQEHKHCTPEQLYLKMLEIGSECISCGTNLKKIKSELSNCGLISTDEDDTTLKILFENSFHDDQYNHLSKYCKCPYPNLNYNCTDKEAQKQYDEQTEESDKFNHYDNCTWFLSQEALMNLLRLRESENNKIAATKANDTAKKSMALGKIALGISLLSAFVPLMYDKCYVSNELKSLQSIDTTLIEQESIQRKLESQVDNQLNQIYNELSTIHQKIDTFSSASFQEGNEKEIKSIK